MKISVAFLLLVVLTILVGVTVYQQSQILDNQKAQMKQQFHSDGIALASYLGEEGLKAMFADRVSTPKEKFAAGLLIQRFVVAYWIRNAYSKKEWQRMVAEGRATFHSPALRERWDAVKVWYSFEVQDFMNEFMQDQK